MYANQQSNGSGIPMPLIMTYTPFTKIEEETEIANVAYDEKSQIVPFNMRMVGTKSLRMAAGTKKVQSCGKWIRTADNKNQIDDSKSVK